MSDKTVSVYGYGRFGKFWADILAEDFHVKVYSRSGVRPDQVNPGIDISDEKGIFDCDAIFFCVSIRSFEEVLRESRPYYNKDTVFFDTCSVKTLPSAWMVEHLPKGSHIIATHPMFGPDSYRQSKRKLPMVMCNIRTDKEVLNEWVQYFTSKSLQVELMPPDEHDRMTASSQGITHYVGRVLADLQLKPTPIDTHGYQLLLHIIEQTCNDSRQLFLDLQNFNPYADQVLRELDASIARINSALKNDDTNLLSDRNERREQP